MPKRGRIVVGDSSAIGGGDAWLSKLKSGTNNGRGEQRSSRRRAKAKERKTSTTTNNNNDAKASFSDIDFINQDEIWTTNGAIGQGDKRNTNATTKQTKTKKKSSVKYMDFH